MKVLVLCHGNRWRSVICKAALSKLSPAVELDSAGFRYPGNKPALSIQNLCWDELGVDVSEHRSKVVTAGHIQWADHIIYMDGGNKRRLLEGFGEQISVQKKDIHLLADYWTGTPKVTRIEDPAFVPSDDPRFRHIFDIIVNSSINFHSKITGGKSK